MKRIAPPVLIALICASAMGAAQVFSQESTSPAPADRLARFIVGSGTCTGKALGQDMKSFHAVTAKYSGEKVLDGHWVAVHYDQDKSADFPKPLHLVQYFGYDTAKKHYVAVGVYNASGAYSISTTPDWKGDSITFDENDGGKTVMFRDIFTTDSSGIVATHTGMMRDKSGKWVKTDEETCTKA